MIPSLAVFEIEAPHFHMARIWLPIFLVWIPVILLSPLILLVIFAACMVGRISFRRAIAVSWGIVCGLPGVHVHVSSHGSSVLVRIL